MRRPKGEWHPLHERIVAELREKMAADVLSDGFVGTEMSLVSEMEVSRVTIRKAIDLLVAEGVLERRAGVGLFVRRADEVTRKYRFLAGNLLWDAPMQMAGAIRDKASRIGAELELRDAMCREDLLAREIASLPESGADGAIILSSHSVPFRKAVAALAETDYPFVVLDEDVSSLKIPCVVADNFHGGVQAGRCAVEAGHREVALLGDFGADTVRARWKGFCKGCAEAGVKPRKFALSVRNRLGDLEKEVRALAFRVLGGKTRPTLLLCSCDAFARYSLLSAETLGLSVPGDLSVIGFDDDPIARWMRPPLTTVRQDFPSMGLAALDLLVKRCGRLAIENVCQVIPVSLIKRKSVGRK